MLLKIYTEGGLESYLKTRISYTWMWATHTHNYPKHFNNTSDWKSTSATLASQWHVSHVQTPLTFYFLGYLPRVWHQVNIARDVSLTTTKPTSFALCRIRLFGLSLVNLLSVLSLFCSTNLVGFPRHSDCTFTFCHDCQATSCLNENWQCSNQSYRELR